MGCWVGDDVWRAAPGAGYLVGSAGSVTVVARAGQVDGDVGFAGILTNSGVAGSVP